MLCGAANTVGVSWGTDGVQLGRRSSTVVAAQAFPACIVAGGSCNKTFCWHLRGLEAQSSSLRRAARRLGPGAGLVRRPLACRLQHADMIARTAEPGGDTGRHNRAIS